MLTRRTLLSSSAAAGGLLVGGRGLLDPAEAAERTARLGPVMSSFVSSPDFFNGDVGDLSTLPTWDGGPNSINPWWEAAIDKVLGVLAAHRADAVLVAGDLVEGRWNLDTTGRALFGPVKQTTDADNLAVCRQAITTAGSIYYGHYADMFRSRGLRLLPALGDHELLDDRIGATLDDRWSPGGVIVRGSHTGEPDNRYHLVPHAKDVWADHFTTAANGAPLHGSRPRGGRSERTAYAVDLGAMLTVITVDVFTVTRLGVKLGVFTDQLSWLQRTIRAAKKRGRIVVVQGHVPILAPTRSLNSGGLRLPQGADSTLHQVLKAEGADFYLCGEVHDTTARRHPRGGPVQVAHGSIFRYAFNYLHGSVYSDGTTILDYYEMTVERVSAAREMWSSDASKAQATQIEYGDPVLRGTMTTRNRMILRQTDKLAPLAPATDTLGYAGRLTPEVV